MVALAEAWVLAGLRHAGVRPRLVRPALARLQQEFGRDYVLVSPELATDGISVLWDFSRTEEGAGLIEGQTGQAVIREIVQDYLKYVGFDADNYPNLLTLKPFEPAKVVIDPYRCHPPPEVFGTRAELLGADDTRWLGKIAQSGWVVLNRDAKIMERPHELEAFRAAKVHMFYLPGMATRDQLTSLVAANLHDVITFSNERTPEVWRITNHGVEKFEPRKQRRR